jgi:hypothetical protein
VHVFFDVDYTILGGFDRSLRPRTHEVFLKLRADGHHVYVWSGEGERWSVVRRHNLTELVSGVYGKPLRDYVARLPEFHIPVVPDFVVDDYPEIVHCFGGIRIPEYFGVTHTGASGGAADSALDDVYQAVKTLAEGGTPSHPNYYPAGTRSG